MEIRKINDSGVKYTLFDTGNFEYVDPIKYYKNLLVKVYMNEEINILKHKDPSLLRPDSVVVLRQRALKKWNDYYNEIIKTLIPESLLKILTAKKKKDEMILLKGLSVTPSQLLAFYFYAYKHYGYKLSQYKNTINVKDIDISELPVLAEIYGDKVYKIGKTNLSENQLKHAISFQKTVIAKVLDCNEKWFCFYVNYKSLKGLEPWKNGRPHYHYLSHKFGIKRDEMVKRFFSHKYLSSSIHIERL